MGAVQEFTPSHVKTGVGWPILAHMSGTVGGIDGGHGGISCGGDGGREEGMKFPLSTWILSLQGPITYPLST